MEALGPTPSPSSRPGRGDLDKDDPVLVLKEFPAPPRMHSRTPVGRGLRGPSQESQPSGIRGRTKPPGMEWTGCGGGGEEADEGATFLLQVRGAGGLSGSGTCGPHFSNSANNPE